MSKPRAESRTRSKHLFGAHMSVAGGLERSVMAARDLGFETVQLFTKNNNQWAAKPLVEAQIAAFRGALEETGIRDPVAHNSYLINLGSPDDELWRRSIDAMVVELERAEALGIMDLVCHPGAHTGSGEEAGLIRIASGLDEVHRRTRGFEAMVDLETTAGQGTCLGHRFEHLGEIVSRVAEPERLGVCVDTCHIFAAGYALDSDDHYNETIDDLERAVGLRRVRVWHVNDSLRPLGSRVDRHAHVGRGGLGESSFRRLLTDRRFDGQRMILETPKGLEEGRELDTVNLETLRRLERARSRSDRGRRGKAGGDDC